MSNSDAEVKTFSSVEELRAEFDKNDALFEEFLSLGKDGEQAWLDKHIKPKEENPVEKPEDKKIETKEEKPEENKIVPAAESHKEEDEVGISPIKIKKELFGTYIKNRSPEDAILEALKGNIEKDKTIDFYKKEKLPAIQNELVSAVSENQRLKKELESIKSAAPKKQEKEIKDEQIDIPEFTDDDDPLSDSFKEKLKKTSSIFKKIKEQNDVLMKTVESMNKDFSETKSKIGQAEERFVAESESEKEYKDLDLIRKSNPERFIGKRPIKEIGDEYLSFMENLKFVAGISSPTYTQSGEFSSEMQNAFMKYNQEGSDLRKKCEERKISLPEDFDDLVTVDKIRKIRSSKYEKDMSGNIKNISVQEAFKLFNYDNPAQSITKAKVAEQSAIEKAKQNREQFSPDIKSGSSSNPLDLSNPDMKKITDIINRNVSGKASKDEIDYVKAIMKSQGITEMEIQKLF